MLSLYSRSMRTSPDYTRMLARMVQVLLLNLSLSMFPIVPHATQTSSRFSICLLSVHVHYA